MRHYTYWLIASLGLSLISCQAPQSEQDGVFEAKQEAYYQHKSDSLIKDCYATMERIELSWEETGNRDSARNAFFVKGFNSFEEALAEEGHSLDSFLQANGIERPRLASY